MPELISQGELARATDLSTRRVRDLEKQGVFKKTERGKYDEHENILYYIRYLKKISVGHGDANLTDVKTRKEIALAETKEIILAKLKGDLVPKEKAHEWLAVLVGEARLALMGLPRRLAGTLILQTDERDIEALLRKEITETLWRLTKPIEKRKRHTKTKPSPRTPAPLEAAG
jgi:phage terminase Nu1 subunit (DNA packaging protein)